MCVCVCVNVYVYVCSGGVERCVCVCALGMYIPSRTQLCTDNYQCPPKHTQHQPKKWMDIFKYEETHLQCT